MKKTLAITLGLFLILFVSGIVNAEEIVITKDVTPKTVYGECVSQKAVIKNTCFNVTKTVSEGCKSIAKESGNKQGIKTCKQTYKSAKKQCKAVFKVSKQECQRTRDSALAAE